MQHRRHHSMDKINDFDEILDEKDGVKGITVKAQYHMQIFNWQTGTSLQREQQIRTDQPLEYAFSFDYKSEVAALETPVLKVNQSESKAPKSKLKPINEADEKMVPSAPTLKNKTPGLEKPEIAG